MRFIWVSLILVSKLSVLYAQDSAMITKLDSLIQTLHEEREFSGAITILHRDSVIYEDHIGVANRSWDIPIDHTTKFDICSLNKSFIAALILIAVEEDQLSLDDRLVDLLKDYKTTGHFDPDITVHDILCHTAGLPDYNGVADSLQKEEYRGFKRLHMPNDMYVDFISQLPPVAQPKTQFFYSNFGYHLLCILLEDLYETTFEDLLQIKICGSLGLKNTMSSRSNREPIQNLAEGYQYYKSLGIWQKNNYIDLSLGRRIFSTTRDLAKWAAAISDATLLTPKSNDQMTTNHLSSITKDISYGYGWAVFAKGESYQMGDLHIDSPYIIHGGRTEGYHSILISISKGQYIIAMLSNTGNRVNEMRLAQKITKILLHEK